MHQPHLGLPPAAALPTLGPVAASDSQEPGRAACVSGFQGCSWPHRWAAWRGQGAGGPARCRRPPGLPAAEHLVLPTACRPWSLGFPHRPQSSPNQSCNASASPLPPSPGCHGLGRSGRAGGGPFCLTSYPVIREDVDVVSVRFWPADRVSVLVRSATPSVMRLYLNTGMDSGGSLTVSLQANKVPSSVGSDLPS